MTVPLRLLAVAPGTTPPPPKLESLSDWQPALISRETDAELGAFRELLEGLQRLPPKGFEEDPLGWEVAETSLRSRESWAL